MNLWIIHIWTSQKDNTEKTTRQKPKTKKQQNAEFTCSVKILSCLAESKCCWLKNFKSFLLSGLEAKAISKNNRMLSSLAQSKAKNNRMLSSLAQSKCWFVLLSQILLSQTFSNNTFIRPWIMNHESEWIILETPIWNLFTSYFYSLNPESWIRQISH